MTGGIPGRRRACDMGIVRRASTTSQPPAGGGAGGPETQPEGAVAPGSLPFPGVDPNGRALPVPDEDWAARQEWLTRELAAIDEADDTPVEVYDQFLRLVDEERQRVGRPPAFGGAS